MKFDAVLVPGGGLADDGSPAMWVKTRLDAALEVEGEPLIILLSAGTPHKAPKLTPSGFPLFESKAGADYLTRRGCPTDRILLDTWSLDTIGNAFFARVVHCEVRRLSQLMVVNSQFHMPRTRAVFDWIFGLTPRPTPFHLTYQSVPDRGLAADVLAARMAKEQAALPQLMKNAASITTLEEAHRFIFESHGAYRYRDVEPTPMSAELSKSY